MSIVSLATVKTYLGVSTTTDDALIQQQINRVESEVSAYLNKRLVQTIYTDEVLEDLSSKFSVDYVNTLGTREIYNRVLLKNTPITTFTNITDNGVVVDASNYSVDLTTGVIYFFTSINDAYRRLKANYTAGYTEATLPSSLLSVILDGTRFLYTNHSTAIKGSSSGIIASKRVGDFSVSYEKTGSLKKYLEENKEILNSFKSVFL